MPTKTAAKKTAAAKSAPARSAPARATPRKPGKTAAKAVLVAEPSQTRKVLAKSRIVVPLLVAVGLGAAVIRRLMRGSSNSNVAAFAQAAKRLPPKVSEALNALAALGRDVRASVGH